MLIGYSVLSCQVTEESMPDGFFAQKVLTDSLRADRIQVQKGSKIGPK